MQVIFIIAALISLFGGFACCAWALFGNPPEIVFAAAFLGLPAFIAFANLQAYIGEIK